MKISVISNILTRVEHALFKKSDQDHLVIGRDDRMIGIVDEIRGLIPLGGISEFSIIGNFSGIRTKTPVAGNNIASIKCDYHLEGTVITSGAKNSYTLELPEAFVSQAYFRVTGSHVSGSDISNLKLARSGDNKVIISYDGNVNAIISLVITGYVAGW